MYRDVRLYVFSSSFRRDIYVALISASINMPNALELRPVSYEVFMVMPLVVLLILHGNYIWHAISWHYDDLCEGNIYKIPILYSTLSLHPISRHSHRFEFSLQLVRDILANALRMYMNHCICLITIHNTGICTEPCNIWIGVIICFNNLYEKYGNNIL